jgi:exopolysaccharide production protein ExoZ
VTSSSPSDARDRTSDPIWSLQYLRGFAALIVVFFHSTAYQALLRGTDFNAHNFGAIGVDIFFVLSGFIVMHVTREAASPMSFVARRAARILPTYWACVALYGMATLLIPGIFLVRSPEHLLSSLFFWGTTVDGKYVDHAIGVAWTLRFEIAFYLTMAVALALSQKYRAYIAGLLLILITAAAQYVPDDAVNPFTQARDWHPGFYEFLYGMAVYSVWKDFKVAEPTRLGAGHSLMMAVGLVVLSLAIIMPFAANGILSAPIHHKHLAWGLPGLAVFCLWLVSLRRFSLSGPTHHVLAFLGASSYAIYLLHPLALTMLTWLEPMPSIWLSNSLWLGVWISFIAATLFGCLGHLLIERPLLAWVLPLVRKRPAPEPQPAAT